MGDAEPRTPAPPPVDAVEMLTTIRRTWGHAELLPLQEEAIAAGLAGRDSLVVMPTGGGKSLCYQVPPLVVGRTDVVVSPLIALMKDQVDGLVANGYPAAALHSLMPPDAQQRVESRLAAGALRLVFVAPERLVTPGFLRLAERLPVGAFAIDEAHCISQWGHDFRPEYRQLALLKERFPHASVHAFTATATERVRADIAAQLGLADPVVLIGRFDRPNLTYRIQPRLSLTAQILDALGRHPGEAALIYCLSRADTEGLAAELAARGIKAAAYHAGMDGAARERVQEAFLTERLDVVVATVAFGMGIDRSNVRLVIHAAVPKSIEHYQQETGRAGRDGLPAECVLFYSAADVIRWEHILHKRAEAGETPPEALAGQLAALAEMQRLCNAVSCRHQALASHFGQSTGAASCGACDVCLGEVGLLADGTVVAQKILSAVARAAGANDHHFGVGHIVAVLAGAETEGIRRWGHASLSTYGLLRDLPQKAITHLVYQLIDQGLLDQRRGDRPVLILNGASWQVLRGQREVQLLEPALRRTERAAGDVAAWEGVDRGLFEHLRAVRAEIAQARDIPAYIVFGDATLRDLARLRPASARTFLRVRGVGERKLQDLGPRFLAEIAAYCAAHDLAMDVAVPAGHAPALSFGEPGVRPRRPNPARDAAFERFAAGASIAEVAAAVGRAESTVWGYLNDYIPEAHPASLAPWVDDATYTRVNDVFARLGRSYLRPVFDELDGRVPYEILRVIGTHRAVMAAVGG
jgi:ATP-dependent DNA helicase RecQ